MEKSLEQTLLEHYDDLVCSKNNLPSKLNEIFASFLSWPLKISPGTIIDKSGSESAPFHSIIHASTETNPQAITPDCVGSVIETIETLNLENLRQSYSKIAKAKALQKNHIEPKNGIPRTETLGVIIAINSTITFEKVSEELQALNESTHPSCWPDMIGILTLGVITYACQFPGENKINNFLLPSITDTPTSIPAFYIIPIATPTGKYTFNRICSIIFGHLKLFSPGVNLPNFVEALGKTPKNSIILPGYQFNLKGELKTVSPQFYIGRYLPDEPNIFKDKKHDFSFSLEYMPWQDGGVIFLKGKMPLEGLLIFLGEKAKNRLSVIKQNELQISSILPITKKEYHQFLQTIQKQTSFILQKPEQKLFGQHFSDEGASSPYMARLFIGILQLRDSGFNEISNKKDFDDLYHPILMKFIHLRESYNDLCTLFSSHAEKVSNGSVVTITNNSIKLRENISRKYRKEFENFICESERILKQGMQKLLMLFRLNIGFLYQQENSFTKGIDNLKASDSLLADYIMEVRKWSEPLIKTRIDIEHKLWQLPDITYKPNGDSLQASEPEVLGEPFSEYGKFIIDKIASFIEEVLVHSFQKYLPSGISIVEIPKNERAQEMPMRFRVGLIDNKTHGWLLKYSEELFYNK